MAICIYAADQESKYVPFYEIYPDKNINDFDEDDIGVMFIDDMPCILNDFYPSFELDKTIVEYIMSLVDNEYQSGWWTVGQCKKYFGRLFKLYNLKNLDDEIKNSLDKLLKIMKYCVSIDQPMHWMDI